MTLIELLIAMTVMAIGISALVAGFSSGILAINRSAKASTAGAVADQQMEAYRQLSFSSIATTATTGASTDCLYKGQLPGCPLVSDSGYDPMWKIDTLTSLLCGGQNYCNPSRPAPTANGGTYRIDSYVSWACPLENQTKTTPPAPPILSGTVTAPTCSTTALDSSCASPPCSLPPTRAVKKVTIIVRDGSNTSKTLIRATSTFDASTG